jgi:hypothetical protein
VLRVCCVVRRFISIGDGAILETVGSFEGVHYNQLQKGGWCVGVCVVSGGASMPLSRVSFLPLCVCVRGVRDVRV